MNWKRIVAGGLVAGLALNIGEFAIEPLMAPQMDVFFRRLGLPQPAESAMVALAASVFVTGLLAVWLYAAIRSRYGPGVRTATIAGTAIWALSCLLPNIVLYAFGVFDTRLFVFATLWPFVETVLATIAGAWVYRESTVNDPSPLGSYVTH